MFNMLNDECQHFTCHFFHCSTFALKLIDNSLSENTENHLPGTPDRDWMPGLNLAYM